MKTRAGLAVVAAAIASVLVAPVNEAHAATYGRTALKHAAAQKGKPYSSRPNPTRSFDCSALTQYAFKRAGKSIPRVAQDQYNRSKKVSPSNRRPGDLIAIGRSSRGIYHVGIYAGYWSGKGWMWNANSGKYRGRKVVLAPVKEYTTGAPRAYYGRF